MDPLKRPLIAVRPKLLTLALIGVVAASGCGHRRTAMRPVFINRAPVIAPAAPCDNPPCATTAPSVSFPDSDGLTSPPLGPASPARPKADDLSPAGGEEPILQPNTPGASSGETPPPLSGPTSGRTIKRRSAIGAERRTGEPRDRVSMFLGEPDELFLPPKADRPWKYIVLHHGDAAEGSYAQIDREHRDRLGIRGCGYHFVVGNGSGSGDGRIEVAARWLEQKPGAHARDAKTPSANDDGIGVCLVGDMDETPPTLRQVEATRALIAYLQERYDIPNDRVVTHAAIAQGDATCPGRLFPADSILPRRGFASR